MNPNGAPKSESHNKEANNEEKIDQLVDMVKSLSSQLEEVRAESDTMRRVLEELLRERDSSSGESVANNSANSAEESTPQPPIYESPQVDFTAEDLGEGYRDEGNTDKETIFDYNADSDIFGVRDFMNGEGPAAAPAQEEVPEGEPAAVAPAKEEKISVSAEEQATSASAAELSAEMVNEAKEKGNLDNIPAQVKARYGFVTKKERAQMNAEAAAELAAYENLPSFHKAKKAQASIAKLRAKNKNGWPDSESAKYRDAQDDIRSLAREYGASVLSPDATEEEKTKAVNRFVQQWESSADLVQIDRYNRSFKARRERRRTERAQARADHEPGQNNDNDEPKREVMPSRHHRLQKAAALVALSATLFGLSASTTSEQADALPLADASYSATIDNAGGSDDPIERVTLEQEKHYNADNLPAADYHLWGHDNGDGTWDTSMKRSVGAFSTAIDTSSPEAVLNYYTEGVESNPEQQAIYMSQLLSEQQLKQLNFTDSNSFADAMLANPQLRADGLNMLQDLKGDGLTAEVVDLQVGFYENFGIIRGADGQMTLISEQVNLGDNGSVEAIHYQTADGSSLYVIEACGNVVIQLDGQTVLKQVPELAQTVTIEQIAEDRTEHADNTDGGIDSNKPGDTDDTDDTNNPNKPDDKDDDTDEPVNPGKPVNPGEPEKPAEKELSDINKENTSPKVPIVNNQPGGVDNPLGQTEQHAPGGSITEDTGTGDQSQGAGAASEAPTYTPPTNEGDVVTQPTGSVQVEIPSASENGSTSGTIETGSTSETVETTGGTTVNETIQNATVTDDSHSNEEMNQGAVQGNGTEGGASSGQVS